jgi:hypothetical protein
MNDPEILKAKRLNGTPFPGQATKQTMDGTVYAVGRTKDGRTLWSNGTVSSNPTPTTVATKR